MANGNFVVHNGLTVGPVTIDAAAGNVTTSGSVVSNSHLFANGVSIVTSLGSTSDILANASIGTTIGLSLTSTGVVSGNYGSATSIPTIVVDSKGRVTSVTSNAVSTTIGLSGTSGTGTIAGGGTLTFASTNGVVTAASGSTLTISTSQDLRNTASPTFANITISNDVQLFGPVNSAGIVTVANAINSTSSTTGALVVTGGVGISNDVFVAGKLSIGTTNHANPLEVGGGIAVSQSGTLLFGRNSYGFVDYGTTPARAGARVFSAGPVADQLGTFTVMQAASNLGIVAFPLYINPLSQVILGGTDFTIPSNTANVIINGSIYISNTSVATSTSTGALQVAGGAGIAGNVYAGSVFDNGIRVVSTSSGIGNVIIASGAINLRAFGPGAATVGSSTAIPVITTDVYGRISAISTANITTTMSIVGTTGTGAVNLATQSLTFTSTTGLRAIASGSTIALSNSQDLQVTASPIFAGITTGPTQVNGTLSATGITTVTNATVSTGAANGAFVVTGGAGVTGTSYFGGDLYVTGNIFTPNLVATSTSTLSVSSPLVYLTAPPYPYSFETGLYSHFIGGAANVYQHTGIVRNHNNNLWTFFSNVSSEPTTTVNFADPLIIYDSVQAGGLLLSNLTASTNTTTGALVVAGGAGIAGNLNVNSAGYFGYLASSTLLTNPTLISTSSSLAVTSGSYYVQTAVINGSATGSADMIAYPNNYPGPLNDHGWVDVGFTGNLFSDPAYSITKANDGYIFSSAVTGAALGGNLVLATDNTGTFNDIVIASGSFYSNAEVARFHGNATTSGYFQVTTGTAATSTATGAVRVAGGVGITGSLYAGGVYTNSLNFANGSPFTSTTLANTLEITANITSGANAGLSLTTTGVTAGTYGSASAIPSFAVDSKGRITSVTTNAVSTTINLAGTTGIGTVAGGGTLTFTGGTGITTSISGSTVTITGTTSITGTANQVIASASTGAITLSLPQSINSGAAPTFAGTNFTSIPSGQLTGTIPGGVLGASTHYIGTTAIALNRASLGQTLTGVSIDGNAGTATSASTATTATNQSGGTVAATTGTFSTSATRNGRNLMTNFTGTTAPLSPAAGDEWYKSDTSVMYKYIYDGTGYAWVNVSSALFNSSTSAIASTLALRDSSANLTAANFIGLASSAKYADLAENYAADKVYEAGTVVVFGGEQEITTTNLSHDTRVAGVISTNPAYLMNSEAVGLPVAFTGRVPCRVIGIVQKGDILVTSGIPGVAQRMESSLYKPGCIIGKALGENITNKIATIEVVVGRF